MLGNDCYTVMFMTREDQCLFRLTFLVGGRGRPILTYLNVSHLQNNFPRALIKANIIKKCLGLENELYPISQGYSRLGEILGEQEFKNSH